MNTQQLSQALRALYDEIREGDQWPDESIDATRLNTLIETLKEIDRKKEQRARLATDLLKVLANIVDGMPVQKAFGAPGDWGYDTPVGKALAAAPVEKEA